MNNIKYGFASVTFRHKSVEEVVEIAASNGVDCIEWGGDVHVTSIEDAQKVKKLCQKNNIEICSYGSYYRIGSNDFEKWTQICKIASELSAESIRVWLGNKNSEDTDELEYCNLLNDAKVICDIADKYHLKVNAECHNNTYNNKTDAILKFVKDLNRPNFGTYFQSYYSNRKYDLDRIERTIPLCSLVHISFRDLKREQRNKQKDDDYICFIIDELKRNNFKGNVLIEFTRWNSEKQLSKDLENFK